MRPVPLVDFLFYSKVDPPSKHDWFYLSMDRLAKKKRGENQNEMQRPRGELLYSSRKPIQAPDIVLGSEESSGLAIILIIIVN